MTCTLLLMRHSYAAAESSSRDFDRPLTASGIALAEATGKLLRELKLVPNLIVTSSAVRTVSTGRCVAEQFDGDIGQIPRDDLYQGRPEAYLPAIRSEATAELPTVLAIGHNPGVGMLMTQLAERRFPVSPATVAVFSTNADNWSDLPTLSHRNATLTHLIIEGQSESIH